jgi:acyl-coenzyme A synthetase/AMP-(fatty) acid ligase
VRLVVNTNYIDIKADDVVAFTQNPTFDVSTLDVWGALLNGARLVVVDRDTLLSPSEFAALVDEERVTVMTLTTQLFNIFSLEIPGAFRHVRQLIFAGETADPQSVRRVLACGSPRRLINAYGPTENTTLSTWYEARDPVGDNIPIGRPISNSTAYVLDACLQPVPVGVTGEIYVGGDGVAQGYHGRPDLTASVFISDPFCGNGATLYRTGDLGCYLPDGNIKFLGRRDGQVKIRGFRVEPDEIRAALETHPSVGSAFIQVREFNGDRRLVAYVTLKDRIETDSLRRYLPEKLPEYMVPSMFIVIDAFPLTPNGKIDLRALPEPVHAVEAASEKRPTGDVELALASIWKDILGLGDIGAEDDFFDLGGH